MSSKLIKIHYHSRPSKELLDAIHGYAKKMEVDVTSYIPNPHFQMVEQILIAILLDAGIDAAEIEMVASHRPVNTIAMRTAHGRGNTQEAYTLFGVPVLQTEEDDHSIHYTAHPLDGEQKSKVWNGWKIFLADNTQYV